jgi:ABC-type oligopeptide transport system ATPase subunit
MMFDLLRSCFPPPVPFLELREVHTYFPIRKGTFGRPTDWLRAVEGVSLSMEKGEILGLVGESGCGKSTLSRTIMQLERATSGEIWLEGEDLLCLPPSEIRKRRLDFQMVFQDPYASLNPRMTVFSTLAEALCQRHPELNRSKLKLTEKVAEVMARVGLDARSMRKYPHEFSGGQRQRIAIARALAPEPKLVLADEPVSALDVSIQSQILNLLLELRKELNLSMIFISHDLAVVHYLADNIAVMNSGKIVEYGPAEELFNDPKDDYTKKLLAAIPKIRQMA